MSKSTLFDSVLAKRVSVRSFKNKQIPKDVLEKILTAATQAPASGNMQPWEFIVVDDQVMKAEVVKHTFSGFYSKAANNQQWIKEAGAVIIACANLKRTQARYGEMGDVWAPLDVAAAVENMLLAATALGLAGCWVGGFQAVGIRKLLHIPDYVQPIGLVPIGYPKEEKSQQKEKLSVKLVTHRNMYNVPYFE